MRLPFRARALALANFLERACARAPARVALLASLSLLGVVSCTPSTPYRYTGLVPAAHALAWDGRTANDGTLRLEGTMVQSTVRRNIVPVKGDTALRVPNTTLEGAALLAAVPYIEFGVRYSYSAYAWSEPSAEGTLALPSHPSVWGVGPELRGTIPLDKHRRFMIGLGGNVMRYDVPYAQWNKSEVPCTIGPTCAYDVYAGSTGTYYKLFAEKSEAHLTLNIGVYPSYALGKDGELGHVFGGFSVHSAFKNDGFADKPQNGSTISDAGLIFLLGAGYSIAFDPFRLGGMITVPTTSASSPVNYGVRGFFTVGVDIELWESKQRRRERERHEREEREAAQPRAPRADPGASPSPAAPNEPPPGVYVIPGPR